MGDVVFCCQHCQESLIVDATGIGMEVPCPRCDQSIQIPSTAIPAEKVQHLVFSEQVGSLPANLEQTLRSEYGRKPPELPPPSDPTTSQILSSSSVKYAAVNIPSRRGLVLGLTMLGLITVGLILALYVQAKAGFTPVEIPPTLDKPRLAAAPCKPGQAVMLGPVTLMAHRVVLGKGLAGPDEVGMVVDFSIENTSKSPVYLAYLWSDLKTRDENGRSVRMRPAEAGTPLQDPIELAPGAVQRVPATYGPVSPDSTAFTVTGTPGVWRKHADGAFVEYQVPELSLSFSRQEIASAPAP